MSEFATSAAEQELESLTEFLYAAPIGLLQTKVDGEILLLNAMSARLLMPLAPAGDLANLFDLLQHVAPDLRPRTQAYAPASGLVCANLRLHVPPRGPANAAQVLSLTLLKLDSTVLMAVVDDVTASLQPGAGD